jgi:hypothetical protein
MGRRPERLVGASEYTDKTLAVNFTARGNYRLRADLRRFTTNQISFVSHRYLQLRMSRDLRAVRHKARATYAVSGREAAASRRCEASLPGRG